MFRKRSYGYGGPVPRQSMQAGALVGGLLGAGKNLVGQLFDDQKGVNIGQVAKAGLAGAAGTIPGVGGMAANMIQGVGQPTPPQPQQPNPAAAYMQPPAAPGAAAFNPYMNNPYQQKNGGMNGVRLMKRGGYNSGVISAQGGNQTPDLTGTIPASDFRVISRMGGEGLDARRTREFYRVNPEGGFTYVGPQSEAMNLLDPTQKEEFMKNLLAMVPTDRGTWEAAEGSTARDKHLMLQSQAFGEEIARDPAYRSAIRQMRQDEVRQGKILDMSPEELGQVYAQTFIKPNPATEAGKQAIGGRAPQGVISAQDGNVTPFAQDVAGRFGDNEQLGSIFSMASQLMGSQDPAVTIKDVREGGGNRGFIIESGEDTTYALGGDDLATYNALTEKRDRGETLTPEEVAMRNVLRLQNRGIGNRQGGDPMNVRMYHSGDKTSYNNLSEEGWLKSLSETALRQAMARQGVENLSDEDMGLLNKQMGYLTNVLGQGYDPFSMSMDQIKAEREAARAGKQFNGGRAPIQAKRGVRVINGYGN